MEEVLELMATKVAPVDTPRQFDEPMPDGFLKEVSSLIQAPKARRKFGVDGSGMTVAVLDTGLRSSHVDFSGRVLTEVNFTNDNGGSSSNAADGNGHGTNVAGIIAANGDHVGIAPGANVIPIKVLANNGGGDFGMISDALKWVYDNREAYNISAVCMSLGDGGNYGSDGGPNSADAIKQWFKKLRDENVVVLVAAGNDFFRHSSTQGMGYPAILRECLSVGAVYDEREGSFSYGDGATVFESGRDRITPFSQRLHLSRSNDCFTNIFAPGAPVTSAGINNDHGESTQHGTSQATPVAAGVVLLMQHFFKNANGRLPSVENIETWLTRGGVTINDGDDENDNVVNTGLNFTRVDAVGALRSIRRSIQKGRCSGEEIAM